MATIAWIGLGNMGGPMAGHLVSAGHVVRGVDPVPAARTAAAERGVRVVATVAAAVLDADAVITSLPRSEHVREVYGGEDGVWATASRASLLLDTSTVDIATSSFCHEASVDHGFRFVDSPVSGGIAGAEAATLTFMLGGAPADVAEATELVAPLAGHVFDLGGPTMGIAAKLANNLMLFVSLLGVAEGSQLAEELGLDPAKFYEVASVSSGESWPLRTWYPVPGVVPTSPANRGFDATFTTVLAEKDLSFAVAAGDAAELHLPAARIALEQFRRLIDEGLGGKDASLIVKYASADGRVAGFEPDEA
ncbi:3-hydroxyisobutyrate dehydrogenase [Agromyces badenianii]|uniref:3-hydroxyisobutyrate dehydrogenase n=1 Tax=Agromyces badenianii TaxID=2080742 RepID=A0A2S0WSI9_9MICO|nr:NAD(P)-binding domain-containing protein [Agromyces badenianii]AWB94315.1 3-hydroxyisobutyrate dehydrogenase [Agromyces badenianii]PWC05676.1 3-hydroxyisobutyrate dehydrogenase [Agromyces badenianii]